MSIDDKHDLMKRLAETDFDLVGVAAEMADSIKALETVAKNVYDGALYRNGDYSVDFNPKANKYIISKGNLPVEGRYTLDEAQKAADAFAAEYDPAKGLTEPFTHRDADLGMAQSGINEIIITLRRLEYLQLPITPKMASEVAEAIAKSVIADTVRMALSERVG